MSDATVAKKPRETDDVPVPPTLRKSLKNRHIQLIALGGAIGTGLLNKKRSAARLLRQAKLVIGAAHQTALFPGHQLAGMAARQRVFAVG